MKLLISLGLVALLCNQAHATDFIVCKSNDFLFGFAEMPASELGNITLSMWVKSEDKKFMTGELIQKSESGDVVAEFPARQKQQGHVLKLSYTASTGEAFLINLENGRSTGDAINGKCSIPTE
jgi:hypothetical protein